MTIPTATPKYGYKFKQWVATSPAVIASGSTSATAGKVKATGTGGKVTAKFEPVTDLNLYVAGRFHVKDSNGNWVNSFDSGDWSNTGDDNIKFTYDSGTKYKLETNASIAELSENISNIEPYFFIYDKTNSKAWHPTASKHLNDSTTTASLTTNTDTYNVRFESTSTDSPVTLYFDVVTKELSYEVPNYYTITCNSATGGTVTSNVAKQKEGQTVTLTLTASSGYNIGSVTVKDASNNTVSVSGTGNTRTFTMPASNVTVTATFTEIKRTVKVYKRYTKQDGTTTTESTATQTITNVGVATTATVNAAATVANYTFSTFTVPSTVTVKTGSASNASSFTITATANATIYIDYTETLYTLTLVNQDSHGNIKKDGTGSALPSIQVGNVTGVTLVATPNSGYEFNGWTKSSDSVTIGSTSSASTTFKTSANATVTANYKATAYSITASVSPSVGATVSITDASGNPKSGGTIGDKFRVVVNLNAGYAVDTITGAPGTGTVETNTASKYEIEYTLGAANVNLTVNLKAATPTLSNIQVKNNTFSFASVSNNGTVNIYYKQPVEAKAKTDSFSTLRYSIEDDALIEVDNETGTSNVAVSLEPKSTDKPTTEDGTVLYTLIITATNAPAGVTAETKSVTVNINIGYNDAQKVFFRFEKLFNRCIREDASNNPYYKNGAPIAAYNAAYNTAQTNINAGYPNFDANEAKKTEITNQYNAFKTAYDSLMTFANKTTVYVLTKYQNTAANPVYMNAVSNGTQADWQHFLMYDYGSDEVSSNNYKMQFAGTFQKSGNRYLYSFTYTGHIKFTIWRGSSATDVTMNNTDKLTGTVAGATAFTKYYVNVYNTNVNSTAVTSCTEYVDFDHTTTNTQKVLLEIGDVKTANQIKALFGFAPSGSLITAPVIATTNTAFSISGPNGSPEAVTYEYVNTSSPNYTTSAFTANKQGKYTVSYTTRFGTDAAGNDIIRTKTAILYVAYDDVTIYVDMNGNIGNPVLNFKYYVDSDEKPTASTTAKEAYLPYEMDLVTGSESIYRYTIKLSKLKKDYEISFGTNNPINVSYITVENNKIGSTSGGFNIGIDARTTGEVWLLADSTQMKTFDIISYGSSANTFVAAQLQTGSTANTLASAMQHISGTGIISDDEDTVYRAHYASLYTLDTQTKPIYHFKSVQRVSAKQEITVGGNTYYFDRWVKFTTPANGLDINNGVLTMPAYSEAGSSVDLNFTDTPSYAEGTADATYVALYKLVSSGSDTVRVEITYEFQDYNTEDGNFVYDENKETVNASYTKTVKIPIGANETYHTYAEVAAAANLIARQSMPSVQSRYFDYSYSTESEAVNKSTEADVNQNKLVLTATLDHTAHKYYIVVLNSSGNPVGEPLQGYYQQSVTLTSGSSVTWKDGANQVLATGTSYTARYVASGFESNGTTNDCQIIRQAAASGSTAHTSVIENSFTEVYYENDTKMLRHNFYIIDYCESTEGKFLGGGVLFATAENGNYRQTTAGTVLASPTSRSNFIKGILGTDSSTEYKAQTINNVGFRYKPYNSKEDVFRYSDEMQAYLTVYEGTNINSPNYENQTLRVYSFMVYDNNGIMVVSSSANYAEVNRYVAG